MLSKVQNTYNEKIKQGDRVRLDRVTIVADPSWKSKNPFFRIWVLEHANEVFTAMEYKKRRPDLWQLVEDDSNPKWLFHTKDLIVVKESPV